MVKKVNTELPEHTKTHPLAAKLRMNGSYYDKALGKQVDYQVANVYGGFGVMYVAGVISGLLGIGSGSFKVMAMDVFMKLPLKVSSATSNFMMGVTAAASAGIYFSAGISTRALPLRRYWRAGRLDAWSASDAEAEKPYDSDAVHTDSGLCRD